MSRLTVWLGQLRLKGPEIYLVVVLLIVGSVTALATPIGGGWDEETHVIRVYELANLELVPNGVSLNKLPFPAIFWNLSYRRNPLVEPVPKDFWSTYGDLPIGGMKYIYSDLETRSVYSPPLLVPYAVIFRYLGLTDRLPALQMYLVARLAGLLSYLFVCWLALRLMPYGRWTFAVVAALPTAVFQAGTIGADPLSNAFAFLFVGSVLHLSRRDKLRKRDLLLLVSTTALLFLCKPNMAFLALLPFIVIRPSGFGRRSVLLTYGAFVVVAGALEVGGWSLIASSHFFTVGSQIDPVGQIGFVLRHPVAFLGAMTSAAWTYGPAYLRTLVAEFGYEYWHVPLPVYVLSGLGLVAALFVDGRKTALAVSTRWALGGGFIVGVVGTFLALYLANTPVGASQIQGVQGRYFSVWILVGALALMPNASSARSWVSRPALPAALGGLAVALFGLTLYLVYHVTCGGSYVDLGLCYLPQYKNWAPEAHSTAPLSPGTTLRQTMKIECDGFTSVRLWIGEGPESVDGSATFEVLDGRSGYVIARQDVPYSSFPNSGALDVSFPAIESSQGRDVSLEVKADDGSGVLGPRLSLSTDQAYRDGTLTVGGQAIQEDLVFKYGCRTGLLSAFSQ
jgi:uncharacterized membrane protein